MQLLVFKRALGVEWYSRTIHLGVKWNGDMECNLVFKIINMLEWYSRTVPLGISNRNFWQVVSIENTWELTKHFYGMGCNFWSLKEQLMWNDIQEQFHWESNKFHGNLIAFWSIRIRKGIIQLYGIGCNSWTSSIGGAIDLEWYYLVECNWESKEQMVSIKWNRMQFMDFLNWRSNWSGMILSHSIQLGMKGTNGINYME